MPLLISAAVFVASVLALTALGTRFYVRPKAALDRVVDTGFGAQQEVPAHPSLVFRDLIQKLGQVMPASPKDVTVMQRRLIRAGFRGENALKYLYGSKALLGAGLPILTFTLLTSAGSSSHRFLAVAAAACLGFFGPNEYVKIASRRRQREISRGLPNALDLLVVCVESGLGLDQAVVQVSKELERAHPDISEEFALVNLELKAGKRRIDALRNLADRTASEDLKKLVAVLIQADRFGTGVAQSLRAHADYMRVQARQVAEEKAAKLGVKLVFPIFFCILPSLFVVTVGPVAVKIVRELLPMMNNM